MDALGIIVGLRWGVIASSTWADRKQAPGVPSVCEAINKPEWEEDPRFTSRHARSANKDILAQAITEIISDMTPLEAVEHFVKYEVAASPANTIAQAAKDPHPWERGALKEVPYFLAGTMAASGDFWPFSRTSAVVGSTSRVGEHNQEILAGLLGFSPEESVRAASRLVKAPSCPFLGPFPRNSNSMRSSRN